MNYSLLKCKLLKLLETGSDNPTNSGDVKGKENDD